MFTKDSKAIIYGLQLGSVQHMLDFDYLSNREPSVLALINPGKPKSIHKLFYGQKELLISSYPNLISIPENTKNSVDTCINFASFRSAYDATLEAIESTIFQNIVIIAEGIPERQTLKIIEKNKKHGINIIGPATVGAMSAGIFRAGNTGGSLENIIDSKLYQAGSVGFVSKSGGMSNELRRVIADRTDGTGLSIALGGDSYNIMNFQEALKILERDESVKMIVMLGEIGGRDENTVAEMIEHEEITKPVVAWCIGTINEQISGEVQFGHAGAKSNKDEETAHYKNTRLAQAGAIIPESFMDFGDKIKETFQKLNIPQRQEMDVSQKYAEIKNRKSTSFTSTISDERGEELLYNGIKISEFTKSPDIGNIIGHLWLKRDLPEYACHFINTVIVLIADHGPAVSGATNAITTSRAGNDIKSCLISGLATIGSRFGGAIDGAGKYWLECVKQNTSPEDFVRNMKLAHQNIPGIGHKVKSKFNPDARCTILEKLSADFPNTKHLDFAKSVEALTLEKKSNLILNVDGYIAAMLLDIFDDLGMDYDEKKMYVDVGVFNGLFLFARSIGFIGHAIDQKRLGEGLYRTSWNDILYTE
ncbi:ATP citrate synthase [Candidatus Gracilibacteria bacterium]|nr:ATP citrate synthase [Candidatus Gracilibacteria bacterium]